MYRNVWNVCHKSVCSINFVSKEGINIITLTGFKVDNLIIADEYIYKISAAKDVIIKFVDEDGITEAATTTLAFWEFQDRLLDPVNNVKNGITIINIQDLGFEHIPSLKLSTTKSFGVGHPIAVIGFQFDQQNLAIKTGIISSYFVDRNDKKYIQFESSIKQGNSGAPLIDVETCEVIGVIGHRLANISKSYAEITKIINKNLKVLKDFEGLISIKTLDPIQVLLANQQQMKHMAKELFQFMNFRYGYATEIGEIITCIENEKNKAAIGFSKN